MEIVAYIALGILGFFVGGFIGSVAYEGFSPYCWYGVCIVWGIPLIIQGSCELGD